MGHLMLAKSPKGHLILKIGGHIFPLENSLTWVQIMFKYTVPLEFGKNKSSLRYFIMLMQYANAWGMT